MKNLLPIPTKDHIPPYQNSDNLCQKMDEIFGQIQSDIIGLKHILDPFACSSKVLDAFARSLNARCKETDTEDTKRHAINNAIRDNQLYSTLEEISLIIDYVCGSNCQVVDNRPSDIWLVGGDGGSIDRSMKNTWSCFGGASATEYGILTEGTSDIWQVGVVSIDVRNNSLTQQQQNELKESLTPFIPVGMILQIGYMENNIYIEYFKLGV